MPPSNQYPYTSRLSTISGAPPQQPLTTSTSTSTTSTTKSRQYAQLQSQLAQLNAHLADTENLMRMTAAQAGDMRFLGGYVGALFMGASKVLGEEGVRNGNVKNESEED